MCHKVLFVNHHHLLQFHCWLQNHQMEDFDFVLIIVAYKARPWRIAPPYPKYKIRSIFLRESGYTQSSKCGEPLISCWLKKGMNLSKVFALDTACLNLQLCNWEQQMLWPIFKVISIIPYNKLWTILHQLIWMIYWYIIFQRRNT